MNGKTDWESRCLCSGSARTCGHGQRVDRDGARTLALTECAHACRDGWDVGMDEVWTTWMGCGPSVGAWTRIGWQDRTHAHDSENKTTMRIFPSRNAMVRTSLGSHELHWLA